MRPRVFSFAKNRTTKFCGGCDLQKPHSAFSKSRTQKDGLTTQCKDCYRAYHHMRQTTDPEYVKNQRAKKNAWYALNAAYARKAWCERASAWKKINPDKISAHYHNRRARKLAIGGVYTDDIADRYTWQREMCAVCRVDLHGKYDVDHITPIIRGGSNFPKNLQLLCAFCNGSKGGKDPIEFMQSRGYLL